MSLIDQLANDHTRRSRWKEFLLPAWFFGLFIWYVLLFFSGKKPELNSTYFVAGISLGIFLNAFSYYRSLNQLPVQWTPTVSALVFVFSGLALESRTLSSGRGALPMGVDFICFLHACLYSLIPVFIFPLVNRQFFSSTPRKTSLNLILALALSGILIVELKCGNRDIEHILWVHLGAIIGMGLAGLGAVIFWKLFRARTSWHEKGKP